MAAGETIVGNLGAYQVMTTEASRAGGPELWQRGLEKAATNRAVRNWGPAVAIVGLGVGWLWNRRTRPTVTRQSEDAVTKLGASLASITRSDDELGCLEVFAEIIESGPDHPMLLGVIVTPGRAQILTIGNPDPGLTIRVDGDLDFDVVKLWFGDLDDAGS